jgi:hypothetical protein
MKILLNFSAFLLISLSGISQFKIDNIAVNYGEEITEDKGKIVKIIGETKSKIYALGLKGKKDYFLKVFSSNDMKMISNNPIEIPEEDNALVFENVLLLNNRLYLFASSYIKKEKTLTLDAFEFNENGILKPKSTKLFESVVEKSSNRGSFYFKTNTNEDKVLIMHTSLFDKEDAMKYELKLFDENLKNLVFKEDKVTYDDNLKNYEFLISDFDLSNNNDLFMVINEGYRDKSKKEKVENFYLYSFKQSTNFKKEVTKINVIDKEIINCKMLVTDKSEVKLLGFYSSVSPNGKAERELKGIYNVSVSTNNLNINDIKFNEFDYATKVKILGERKAKKGKDLNPVYEIHSIVEKNDGGIIVLSEYSLTTVGKAGGFGPFSSTPITYKKNEIIVNSLKKDGSLEWSNVVGKEQTATATVFSLNVFSGLSGSSTFAVSENLSVSFTTMSLGKEYMSAIPFYNNGELSVLFNDHIKNKGVTNLDDLKSIYNFKNSLPTIYHFDAIGNVKRIDPEDALKNELVFRPGVYYRKNDKEYIAFLANQSKDKLARMFIN